MSDIKLFEIHSHCVELHGYKDVKISWFVEERPRPLFGPRGSLNTPYRDVFDGPDIYDEMAADELFTEAEAAAFVEWIKLHRNYGDAMIKPEALPISCNIMSLYGTPIGGGIDHLLVGESLDYDLPFKVSGYHDVIDCEFDPTLPGARRKLEGFRVVNGRLEPWPLGDDEKAITAS